MNIKELYLKNFRGFENKLIPLNPHFTAAIGDNGMGKSTLLYGLQVALGAYLQCLPIPASPVYRRQFKKSERYIRWDVDERSYVSNREETLVGVTSEFGSDKKEVRWSRVMSPSGKTSHNKYLCHELMDAVDELLYKRETNKREIFPVVASFGTERTANQLRKGRHAQGKRSRIEKAYLAALGNKVDFNGVIEWLHNYDKELQYEREFLGTREAVFEAISTAIPYLNDVGYNNFYHELEAVVTIDEKDLGRKTHSNMSDGLIAMLNLVAELAFRCVVLNGFLGNLAVKESTGIVMIDELDMHLHPNWQKHVIRDLKSAFPKLQFVVTTHSPFIVQSLNSDELINLDKLTDVNLQDLTVDEVATEVMGVDSEFSIENQEKYEDTKKALVNPEQTQVGDPLLRAFLELTRDLKSTDKK
ncbi:AAA family ATPase [Flavobacterium yafengii]|uniref:AAA family ATPase n=1 Tax=Flavobacterium yafengii TaxID=3041253 RepID=UPI0024A92728|nr:AAA family ATPase [Flavobacterium yafengii]MDI5889164.1 AAA family ATPase [Flavobacterium yafengii]